MAIAVFNENQALRLLAMLRAYECGQMNPRPQKRFQSATPDSARIAFRNDSGEAIPPFSVMRITGAEPLVAGDTTSPPVVTVEKPDTTFHRLYLVNTGEEVPDGKEGIGTYLHHARYVAYNDSAGTPAYGEVWGPKSGQWTLEKYRHGFLIQGHVTEIDGVNVVLAVQHLVTSVRVKTNGAHARGASQAVHLYDANDADTSVDIAGVLNSYVSLEDNVWADVLWQGQKPVLVAGDCTGEE
jgi:hypothetical protein